MAKEQQESISAPRLWLVLARAHSSMVTFIEGSMDSLGLGLSDFMVLEVLLHKGAMTISAIGEKVLLASASMTSAIDRLEKKRLVVRKGCSTDRRIRIVDLTPEGRRFIEKTFAEHAKELGSVMDGLSDAERRTLYEGLKKLGLAARARTLGCGSGCKTA